jgi:F420-0:gamma-glutamyl ligase
MRYTGVTSRGIITPIFKQGDDLVSMIADSVIKAAEKENFSIQDRDIIGVTEAVLARTQGNYATCEQIAADIRSKFGGKDLGIVFPILSRNRFLLLLKAIAMSCEKLYVQLSYPADEVGNSLITLDDLDETQVDPYTDSFTEVEFRKLFKNTAHIFTGVDYIEVYKNIGKHVEIIFSNNPSYILNYTKNVLNCDIHSRKRTQKILRKAGAEKVYRLDEILTSSVQGSGYNEEYGLLGSNNATGDSVKLFPRDAQIFVEQLQKRMSDLTGKHMEVMVYGDGCFKDPVGGIWEFADPVVSPGFTSGLLGTPHELKMKYFADNEFASLSGEDLISAMKERIKAKENDNTESMSSLGTTPRRITDLLGSLCDLTSGSGDRGTPVVLIQGYFNDFAS